MAQGGEKGKFCAEKSLVKKEALKEEEDIIRLHPQTLGVEGEPQTSFEWRGESVGWFGWLVGSVRLVGAIRSLTCRRENNKGKMVERDKLSNRSQIERRTSPLLRL